MLVAQKKLLPTQNRTGSGDFVENIIDRKSKKVAKNSQHQTFTVFTDLPSSTESYYSKFTVLCKIPISPW